MNKIFKLLLISFVFFVQCSIFASSTAINAYFFYSKTCSHCDEELNFLQKIKKEHPNLEIKSFEVNHNRENATLLQKIAASFKAEAGGLPFLVIGNKYFIGYAKGVTSEEIKNQINECEKNGCIDQVKDIIRSLEKKTTQKQDKIEKSPEKIINLPILGKFDAFKVSLLILTVIMGILDGFNPCAMWSLIFLISLLLGMKDRKRMWFLGSSFIVASAFVYFMFMSAWLNFFLFLGFIVWVRIAIGGLALLAGGYRLKEFFFDKGKGCKVNSHENREKVSLRLKSIVERKSFWLALGGIIVLAFMVNLIELICSAGLPAVYTQVLALSNLATWQYYSYIFLYIFFYMLDDLIIFFIAMITLEITGLSTKYVRYSQLFGGLIMLIIGLFLIFKPEWLIFG